MQNGSLWCNTHRKYASVAKPEYEGYVVPLHQNVWGFRATPRGTLLLLLAL